MAAATIGANPGDQRSSCGPAASRNLQVAPIARSFIAATGSVTKRNRKPGPRNEDRLRPDLLPFPQRLDVGHGLQDIVLRYPVTERLHGPGATSVDDLEHALVAGQIRMAPLVVGEAGAHAAAAIWQMARLAILGVDLLAFGRRLLVTAVGILGGAMEFLDGGGDLLARQLRELDGLLRENIPEDDRL